jgi:colicin import membrane protein
MQVVERKQERPESSIVQSLSELRDIERQRLADELAARQLAEAARREAREAEERRAREEAAARAKAEREAQLAAEHARLEAEREARRRIDAAAAAELARQQVALEHTRLEREVELRREQVARTRPTWMLAVTGLSLAAAGLLLWVALSSRAIAEEASDRARLALLDRDAARAEAGAAQQGLERVQQELERNTRTIRLALEEMGRATKQAERDAVAAKLQQEQQRLRELEAQRQRELERRRREEQQRGFQIPPQCKDSPFAPGCPGQ